MQLLVSLLDLSMLIDPHKRVLDLLAILRGFVNADGDGQPVFLRGGLKTQDEGTGVGGLNERDSLGG